MARLPWMQSIDIPFDENGNPVMSGVTASIAGPNEPFDEGEIAGTTQQMLDALMMQNAGANAEYQEEAQADETQGNALPVPQMPQAQPNWYQPQNVQTEPQAVPEQGGNFFTDMAYNAVGNLYTPWERNAGGQWEPNRKASVGSRIGTALGQLFRAAPGLQYSPGRGGRMGTFRYDPYAGSYLNRQNNQLMMQAGRMNDQYDPDMQAALGQASGRRYAAYRDAAGIPAPLTPEQKLQEDMKRVRAMDQLNRELYPWKSWDPEQQRDYDLDTYRRKLELQQQDDDPMAAVKQGWQILQNYHENPTPENRYYAAMVTREQDPDTVIQGMFNNTGRWYNGAGGASTAPLQSFATDKEQAMARTMNMPLETILPEGVLEQRKAEAMETERQNTDAEMRTLSNSLDALKEYGASTPQEMPPLETDATETNPYEMQRRNAAYDYFLKYALPGLINTNIQSGTWRPPNK
jgi:hypothetical protein